jgi:hypothetical protein
MKKAEELIYPKVSLEEAPSPNSYFPFHISGTFNWY